MLKRSSLASAFVLVVSACGVFGSEDETPSPAGPGDSTPDAGGAADATINEPPPAPPVVGGTVSTDEITEKFGVFVTTTGTPTGEADGSRDKPYATIALGIENGKAKSKRIYVCQGTYKEVVTIQNTIQLIGGFDCTNGIWKKADAGAMTRVEAPTSPAVIAEGITGATRVEGFEVIAPDGTDASPTSIGLRAKSSASLTFVSSKITAGRGRDGAPGVDGIQLTPLTSANGTDGLPERYWGNAQELNSGNVAWRSGSAGGSGTCIGAAGYDAEMGGAGGAGATLETKNTNVWSVYVATKVVNGMTVFTSYVATAGEVKSGVAGGPGADGLSSNGGGLSAAGFAPGDGTAGLSGSAGKGGSGGTGGATVQLGAGLNVKAYAGTGPGGGAGGCPGLAGTPGKGGGGSIGALLIDSPVAFNAVTVTAGDGGAGGKGTFGSSPSAGGAGGVQTATSSASGGAHGGPGGRSGISGSGAGGVSIGIGYTGGAPQLTNGATAVPGKAGSGVPAETKADGLGNSKTLPASASGLAKDVHPF